MLRFCCSVAVVIFLLTTGGDARSIQVQKRGAPRGQIKETSELGTLNQHGKPSSHLVLGVKGPGETPVKSNLDDSWYQTIYGDKVGWNPWELHEKLSKGRRH